MYKIIDESGKIQDSSCYYPKGRFKFQHLAPLTDGEIELHCINHYSANETLGYVPTYMFEIRIKSLRAGQISLRVGFNENIYYGGHIGYSVDEPFRGNAYSYKACLLLRSLAKFHGLTHLIITTNPDNYPSRRTCEKLGCVLLRQVNVPPYNEMYKMGEHFKLIYDWKL